MFEPMTRLSARARKFLADAGAVAAVEMALIAPVALLLLSLGVAGGQTMTLNHKIVNAAHSVTDLVSRTVYSPDSNNASGEVLALADLDTDLALSSMIIYPNSTTGLSVVMSELQVNASNNTGTVVWSYAYYNGTAIPKNTVVTLNPSYISSGAAYLLYGQVSYTFQPLGGVMSLPPITLSSTETLPIRNAQMIDVQ